MSTGSSSIERKREAGVLDMSPDGFALTVKRPDPLRSLLAVLSDLEKISERVAEDQSHDLGAGGAVITGGQGKGVVQTSSLRQKAIDSLPVAPVMRRRLTRHLSAEVHQLERKAKRISRRASSGSAHVLNEMYARIRKIQGLIADLGKVALEIVQKLYVRLFVDHQQLV